MSIMKEQMNSEGLQVMHELSSVLFYRVVIEKTLNESTSDRMLEPIGKLEFPEKVIRAQKLLEILNMNQDEQEILRLVAELDKES